MKINVAVIAQNGLVAERNDTSSDVFYTVSHSSAVGITYEHWVAAKVIFTSLPTYYKQHDTLLGMQERNQYLDLLDVHDPNNFDSDVDKVDNIVIEYAISDYVHNTKAQNIA